jgi:protein O-mannosyl-transferase
MSRTLIRAALLVLAGAITYATSVSRPFIFDDDAAIVENAQIRELTPSVALAPQRESPTAGRPIVNLSFALNYAIGGLNVTGYHVGNIAIHLLCALVLFGVVRRTLELPALPAPLRHRADDLAFAIALIWVVHPLNSEAVDYLTQRTESLMALFYLLTLYCAIRVGPAEAGRSVRSVRLQADLRWTVAAIVSCALGMGCKESMVTAPLMVVLYDRAFRYDSFARALRERTLLYSGLASTWVLLAFFVQAGPRKYSAGFQAGVSAWTYLMNQAVMIVRYLRLAVWPRSLVIAYGIPLPYSLGDILPQALLVVALLALTAYACTRDRRLGFLGLWFFLTLAPTSTFVPVATEVGAERRMYLPIITLIALAIVTIGPRLRRVVAIVVLVAASTALSAQTIIRNREYVSSFTLAETVLDRWPTGFAHALYGVELSRAGRHDEALAHLRESVGSYPKGHFHLGVELFAANHYEEALPHLQQFVAEQPILIEAVRARTIIGRILLAKKRYPEAIEQFRLVLSMTSPNDSAHVTAGGFLADALFGQGKFADALPLYQSFVGSRPTDAGALINLGISLANTGRPHDATTTFRRAVEVSPNDLTARRNLARSLFNEGLLDAADAETNALLRIKEDDAGAHDLKGRLLATRGDLVKAKVEFERAVALDPSDQQAREDLALLLSTLRGR